MTKYGKQTTLMDMPYILEARALDEQMPRLAWLEATGQDDEIRLTFAHSFGVIATGHGRAEELESFATSGGDCICSGNLWVERTDQAHLWMVSVVASPEAGTFCVNAFDLTCGLQQVQLDRLLTSIAGGDSPFPETDARPRINGFSPLQVARGTFFDA